MNNFNVNDYCWRSVKRETEKAFLVEVKVSNRRDGTKLVYKWIAKSICKEVRNIENFEKFALVPLSAIGNGTW